MNKTASKKSVKRAPIFSVEFASAVKEIVDKLGPEGDSVKRSRIAHELRKSARFGIPNREMLRILVGLVVQEARVDGTHAAEVAKDLDAIRGRTGGVYNTVSREAWNRAVEAGEVEAQAEVPATEAPLADVVVAAE